jgi:hypothetical protein
MLPAIDLQGINPYFLFEKVFTISLFGFQASI